MHFPQRRKLAQLGDLALQELDRVIDLFLSREPPDGEANGAVRELIASAERAQHIRRFERRRRACRARRHRDILDRHDQTLALDEVEAYVEVVRYAPLDAPVDIDLLDLGEALPQLVAEHP